MRRCGAARRRQPVGRNVPSSRHNRERLRRARVVALAQREAERHAVRRPAGARCVGGPHGEGELPGRHAADAPPIGDRQGEAGDARAVLGDVNRHTCRLAAAERVAPLEHDGVATPVGRERPRGRRAGCPSNVHADLAGRPAHRPAGDRPEADVERARRRLERERRGRTGNRDLRQHLTGPDAAFEDVAGRGRADERRAPVDGHGAPGQERGRQARRRLHGGRPRHGRVGVDRVLAGDRRQVESAESPLAHVARDGGRRGRDQFAKLGGHPAEHEPLVHELDDVPHVARGGNERFQRRRDRKRRRELVVQDAVDEVGALHGERRRVDPELGTEEREVAGNRRQQVVEREHRARRQQLLLEAGEVPLQVARVGQRHAERADQAKHVEDGILQPAVGARERTRLGVQQDRPQRRPHVAVRGGKRGRHALDVVEARVAGDERPDQAARDERRQVLVPHDAVDDVADVVVHRRGAVAGRLDMRAQQPLLADVVVPRKAWAVRVVVGAGGQRGHHLEAEVVGAVGPGVGPARQRARVLHERLLRVRRRRLAGVVEVHRAIDVELPQPEREELQQLAREVLVGRGVGLTIRAGAELTRSVPVTRTPVEPVVQVLAHRRAEHDLAQERAVAAERVPRQQLHPRRHLHTAIHLVGGHHDDLAQGEDHALAQLVRRVGHVEEHGVPDVVDAEVRRRREDNLTGRQRELAFEPRLVALGHHQVHVRLGRPERGLLQQVRRGAPVQARSLSLDGRAAVEDQDKPCQKCKAADPHPAGTIPPRPRRQPPCFHRNWHVHGPYPAEVP